MFLMQLIQKVIFTVHVAYLIEVLYCSHPMRHGGPPDSHYHLYCYSLPLTITV